MIMTKTNQELRVMSDELEVQCDELRLHSISNYSIQFAWLIFPSAWMGTKSIENP